ncbi:hypothetical protein [Streptomyces turgidiscabies]|uniref:Secreted protein n=1 Tax=Streptomyces turgidiscabies TaxID=85558 RepID=A0ABU0RGR5_9ACTN|nr:hypothetical protein [Streptomyces turgidiscabies]MDQ0931182.1 hypothetical protein [Streptomyces turgidiscabies]
MNKKKNRRWLASAMGVALTPLVLLAASGSASADTWCWKPDGYDMRKGDTTWAKSQTQAANTWEDWVFRGPTFRCPTNVPGCSYAWGQTKTSGWQWNVDVAVSNPIPYLNKILPSVTPNYGRSGSTSTSFTNTVNLRPGQYAQPIQLVLRRWTKGTFVGAFRTDHSSCGGGQGAVLVGRQLRVRHVDGQPQGERLRDLQRLQLTFL